MTTARVLRNTSPRELAAALAAPAPDDVSLRPRLRELLAAHLAAAAGPSRARRWRVDAFSAERAGVSFATPFEWSARASRRVLGTAAARSVAAGVAVDPLTAARAEIERLCDRATRGLARPGSLGVWLEDAAAVVRAACAVEAATWTSGLLAVVEPGAVAVGVADAWFDVPGAAVTLHGRRDALAEAAPHGSRVGLLRLRDGVPGRHAADGLLVDGLVEALSAHERGLPARVVGSWPDAGICLVVEFDEECARRAARIVVDCATRIAAPATESLAAPVAA